MVRLTRVYISFTFKYLLFIKMVVFSFVYMHMLAILLPSFPTKHTKHFQHKMDYMNQAKCIVYL